MTGSRGKSRQNQEQLLTMGIWVKGATSRDMRATAIVNWIAIR